MSVESGLAPAVALSTPWRRFLSLFKVAKFTVHQHYYGLALVVTLLPSATVTGGRAVAALVCCLVSMAAVVAATTALDDLTGFRNGGDALNYGTQGRGKRRKPLLEGAVTERDVLIFSGVAELIALAAGAMAFALAPHRPPLAVALFVGAAVFSVQYSWGLSFSFRAGGGELLVFASTAATVYWPYLILHGRLEPVALLEGALLGLWFVLVVMNENANDAAGDLAVGRRTLAAAFPLVLTRVLVVGGYLAGPAAVVAAVAAGWLPWLVLVLLVPAWVMQGRHLVLGVRQGRWLRAAIWAFLAIDAAALALAAANAIYYW
jgi:1,4-dihydroxy-2-naphthoate octaprenyltransferase